MKQLKNSKNLKINQYFQMKNIERVFKKVIKNILNLKIKKL